MQFIDHQGVACLSFRQLDELNGLPKGSSFRVFKRLRPRLIEGRDYFYLDAAEQARRIEALRQAELIYRSSTHVVLLARSGYERMRGASPGGSAAS